MSHDAQLAAPLVRTGTQMEAGVRKAARRPKRIPRHIGLIPDGNRRWAQARGAAKREGYAAGIEPGLRLLDQCRRLDVEELSIYGFTKENVHRPADQVHAFRDACVEYSMRAIEAGAALCVIGDTASALFPLELQAHATTRSPGDLRVNLLVNYGWQWDLAKTSRSADRRSDRYIRCVIASSTQPRTHMASPPDPDHKAVHTPVAGHDIKTLGPNDSFDSGSDMARPGLIDDDVLNLDRDTQRGRPRSGARGRRPLKESRLHHGSCLGIDCGSDRTLHRAPP